jgi:hypothetical protein
MKNFNNLEGDCHEHGITKFLSKHKCNEVCKALGLKDSYLIGHENQKWIEKSNFDHTNK